jgi:hypothetical protein
MRTLLGSLALVFVLGCVNAGTQEEQGFEDRQADRVNACNQAAWEQCAGAPDRDACVQRAALGCDTNVENRIDPNRIDPVPSGIENADPVAP